MAKILIVDDSMVMRRNIRLILEQAGHVIVGEASDGREVLPAYVSHKPDLVTLDISMASLNGVEALKILMKSFPDAQVIMISAMGQKQQVLEAIRFGAKSYLVKPIDGAKLVQIVTKVLGNKAENPPEYKTGNETEKKTENKMGNKTGK